MVSVRVADPSERRFALDLLLSPLPTAERTLQVTNLITLCDAGQLSLEGLLVACNNANGDEILGAILVMMQPDGCGLVWPPNVDCVRVAPDRQPRVADALLQAACGHLDEHSAWLGQCLLDVGDDHADEFLRNGFQHLTDLRYLQRRNADQLPPRDRSLRLQMLRLDPQNANDAARIAAVISQTYIDSADCPELSGLRTGAEAVEGHRSTGDLLRDQWLVFNDGHRDVGLLIFADQPDQSAWELVYTGVATGARGQGYGRDIVEQGLRNAAESGRDSVLLAVDVRNNFAQKIYESLGFREIAAKAVFVRPKPPTDSANR